MAAELNAPKIEYNQKLREQSSKIHLSDEQLEKMLKYDVLATDIRKDRKQNLLDCQNLTRINSIIGLCINELLGICKDLITFVQDYCRNEFVDFKTKQIRAIIIKDIEAMEKIRQYCDNSDGFPFAIMDYKLGSS